MNARKRHRLRNYARRARNYAYERALMFGGMTAQEARAIRATQGMAERLTFGSYQIYL